MNREVVAHRSGVLVAGTLLFFGGSSLWVLYGLMTHPEGFDGYLQSFEGSRGSPHLLVIGAFLCIPVLGWWLIKMATRREPPVYLVGDLLFSEHWPEPLDMASVQSIGVEQIARSYQAVFHLKDATRRALRISHYVESASSIAADLGARYDLPVDDPTIEP